MKIVYLTNQLYLHGGIEKMLVQKMNHWISYYNYEVVLCTTEQRHHNFVYPVNAKLRHIDLAVNYSRKRSYFHPVNLVKILLHYVALKKFIKKEKPDIIVSVNNTPEQFFLPFLGKQIPKIKEFHSSGIVYRKPHGVIEMAKHMLFLLLDRYQAKVILNKDEKKYYPFCHVHVIPNFIEINKVQEPTIREKTIIAAGRIAPVKQFDHLIKAWSQIASDFPEWQLKIFGDGDQHLIGQLNQLINELQLSNIQLFAATDRLDEEMRKASIYAMTSATECFPMVLLEAQASGLPIISYDCPNGPRNIIKSNREGQLIAHNEIGIFAHGLSALIKNQQKRDEMGRTAKENSSRFSKVGVMQHWDDLFKKLIK